MRLRMPVAAIALAACAGTAERENTSSKAAAVGCPELGCNLNAASLGDGLYFHELEIAHAANTVGVRYDRFESPSGAPLALGETELASLIDLIQSRLDVSLERVLASGPAED